MKKEDVVVIGHGSQARAWCLNLKDSKRNFIIALRPESKTIERLNQQKIPSIFLNDPNLKNYKHFILLIPDNTHLEFFDHFIAYLPKDAHIIYAHGFSFTRFKLQDLFPNFSHSLLAPKAIAAEVRFQYEIKGKIGAAIYSTNETQMPFLYDLAEDLGFNALYENHFEKETIADLFSEQSLLCSLLPYAASKSFNLLTQNGVSEELAFMECFLELRSISKALVEIGPLEFFKMISPNALIGSEKAYNLLFDADFDNKYHRLMDDIKKGKFYHELDTDYQHTRDQIINRWKHDPLSKAYQKLKGELI